MAVVLGTACYGARLGHRAVPQQPRWGSQGPPGPPGLRACSWAPAAPQAQYPPAAHSTRTAPMAFLCHITSARHTWVGGYDSPGCERLPISSRRRSGGRGTLAVRNSGVTDQRVSVTPHGVPDSGGYHHSQSGRIAWAVSHEASIPGLIMRPLHTRANLGFAGRH